VLQEPLRVQFSLPQVWRVPVLALALVPQGASL
jgi:hypothetical protein